MFEAPDTQLNFLEGILEDSDFKTALRGGINDNYHAYVIRNQLTQNISHILPEMVEELDLAFQEELIVNDDN